MHRVTRKDVQALEDKLNAMTPASEMRWQVSRSGSGYQVLRLYPAPDTGVKEIGYRPTLREIHDFLMGLIEGHHHGYERGQNDTRQEFDSSLIDEYMKGWEEGYDKGVERGRVYGTEEAQQAAITNFRNGWSAGEQYAHNRIQAQCAKFCAQLRQEGYLEGYEKGYTEASMGYTDANIGDPIVPSTMLKLIRAAYKQGVEMTEAKYADDPRPMSEHPLFKDAFEMGWEYCEHYTKPVDQNTRDALNTAFANGWRACEKHRHETEDDDTPCNE